MENTWLSNGHVSNRFEGHVLHPKQIMFNGKEGKKREKKRKKGREKKKGKKKKGKKIKDREKGKERKEGELCKTSVSKKKRELVCASIGRGLLLPWLVLV